MCRRSKKEIDCPQHPFLVANIRVILMGYFLSGINLVMAGITCATRLDGSLNVKLILLGVIMLLMVPISLWDNRKEMRGRLVSILVCIMHFAICCLLSFVCSFEWLIIYVCEVLLCSFVIIVFRTGDG